MDSSTFTTLVQALQVTVVTSLIFIGGLSSCLSLWVVPLTARLPPKLLTKQFKQTFVWGGQYLLPSSRALGAFLLLTTILTSRLPDPAEAEKWRNWAVLFCTLITIAPYEIYLIFPINDRVAEIGEELEKGAKEEGEVKKELKELLAKWQFRNFGRVAMPVFVGVAGMVNIIKT
ncbi:hypothetical protein CC86DRAFT_279941 [Ophiobolus disseminans]|uniref:DUF1772-domain-containing protein n=1 Tax=Ophiobolus disseminans TaxID=1469910 RepID=A0A6A7AII3_9PLEO|nr:hypothetical protein CC86DRAFT_279941 [Ophiobolus disseminans]